MKYAVTAAYFDPAVRYVTMKALCLFTFFCFTMRRLLATNFVLLLSCSICLGVPDESSMRVPGCSADSFVALDTGHFRIIHQAQNPDIEKIAGLLDIAYERFHFVFSDIGFALKSPKENLTWICFDDSGRFNNYALKADKANLSWLTSYYSTKTNIVAIVKPGQTPDSPGRTLSNAPATSNNILAANAAPELQNQADTVRIMHEAAHQLAFNTGLQKRNVMYPLWVSEGLATMFETACSGSCDSARNSRLAEMQKNHRLRPLSEFVTITTLPADAELQKDFYAQACGLFEFLSQNHKDKLTKYFAVLYDLKTGPRTKKVLCKEFIASFGPIEKIDKSWLDYVAGLSPKPQ
jgi:hypothetical protein